MGSKKSSTKLRRGNFPQVTLRSKFDTSRHNLTFLRGLRAFRIVGVMFVLGGIGFGVYSIAFGIGAKDVQGIVTQMDGGSPVVDYEVGGQHFSLRSPISSSPPAYSVGDKVVVLYRPNNPASAQNDSFIDRWFFAVVFSGVGIVTVISSYLLQRWIGIVLGSRENRWRRHSPLMGPEQCVSSSTVGDGRRGASCW